MRRRIVPFSLCFRSFTSPVPRSFHSGRSFSDANRKSFARLKEERISEVSLYIKTLIETCSSVQYSGFSVVFLSHTIFFLTQAFIQHVALETDIIYSSLISH